MVPGPPGSEPGSSRRAGGISPVTVLIQNGVLPGPNIFTRKLPVTPAWV